MTDETGKELEPRRSPRVTARIRVVGHSGDCVFSDYAINLSEGGMCVTLAHPLDVNRDIELQFTLEDDALEPLQLQGKVRWADHLEQRSAALRHGIEFHVDDLETRQRLSRWISTRLEESV